MRKAKNQKDFRQFSSAGTVMDKIVNITNNEFIPRFDMMYQHTRHNWYMYSDGKELEILYNT